MPTLIITADDCGLSEANTLHVVDLHRHGYLTAASVLTNYPAHRDALARFAECPDLDVGVHLNLTDGFPATQFGPHHSHLLRGDRRFRSKFQLYLRGLFFNPEAIHWIRNELDLQMRRCVDGGITPQHITTHHHFHTLPILREIVHELAAVYQVRWVRGHDFRAMLTPSAFVLRPQRDTRRHNFLLPDYLSGVQGWMKRPAAEFAQRIAQLEGTIEIVAHPAPRHDPDFPSDIDYGSAPRRAETQYLHRLVDELSELGIAPEKRSRSPH